MKGLIGNVILFAIIIVSTVIVINSITPLIQESQDIQKIDDAKKILKIIDSVANQLSIESTGAKRSITINLPANSKLVFSGSEDKVKIRVPKTNILTAGGRIEEENIVITGGGTLDAYEKDIDNDGDMDLVLENPAVLFAIEKLGSESSHVTVNTTSFISLVRNKRQNIDIMPRSGIFINEKPDSAYGLGYTTLSKSENLQTASILAHLNSTANITYDAIFTLSAGLDFVEMEVRNVKGSLG